MGHQLGVHVQGVLWLPTHSFQLPLGSHLDGHGGARCPDQPQQDAGPVGRQQVAGHRARQNSAQLGHGVVDVTFQVSKDPEGVGPQGDVEVHGAC